MKLSVIIPAYNAAKTLERCLDSIINQTYTSLEIIVVNDGSSDDTLKICEKYAKNDNRIIIINNENNGVSYSRNCGINAASGDYITFVDSDDYLDLNCFEIVLSKFNKNVDFVRYNFNLDGDKGFDNNLYEIKDRLIELNDDTRGEIFKHFLTRYDPIPNLVMLLIIKTEIAKKLQFNEKLTMMEDVDFYIKLMLISNKVYFCDEKLYNYYVNPMSVTHDINKSRKNVFGILDTNQYIVNNYDYVVLTKMQDDINANHIRIITNILIDLYFNEKTKYKSVIRELKEDKIFIKLCHYGKLTPNKNRILIFLIRHDMKILEILYLHLLRLLYKILRKNT